MKFCVIVPTRNESEFLTKTLDRIRLVGTYHQVEVIVVDAQSNDSTFSIAKRYTPHVFVCKPNRSIQMNYGAKKAKGDVFLFLHADVLLPENAFDLISKSLQDKNVVGGAFYKKYQEKPLYLNQILGLFKNKFFKLFFGNEAIFVRRLVFEKMGGFREMSLMEDVDFSKRLKRVGKVVCIPKSVRVSARRYLRKGRFRQLGRNIKILILYFCGVSPKKLKKMYEK